MKHIKQIIQLYESKTLSIRDIGRAKNLAKSTVDDYINRYKKSTLNKEALEILNDNEIYQALFGAHKVISKKSTPDFSYIHKELKRVGVTRELLWEEYRNQHPDGYGYTQFCNLYKAWRKTVNVSMRQVHKAGDKTFIDYSGQKPYIINKETGEVEYVELFVAVLGASGYTFAEATRDQTKPSFIEANVHSFEYFGGVTKLLIPDNLKSAVNKADNYEATINESYQDMAEHYGTAVMPARPRKPKDKAKV